VLRLFEQGGPLDPDVAMINPPPSRQSTAISLIPDHPPVHLRSFRAEAETDTDSTLYAMHLQREFDEEDRALSTQCTELVKSGQGWFECGICMDEMSTDSIAIIDSCGHTFCRECLRGHVTVRLYEHRFPILCPTCTAGKGKGKGKTGGTCVYSQGG
jgi:Ring finger domain